MNDYYFIVSGWGYPQTIIYNPKLIFKMSEASTRVPSCRKSTSNTKTSTPHTQNHDLETEYDTQLPSRKLDAISLKIDGWKTTFQLGFDFFHFGKLYSFKHVCFWNALQTCLAFFLKAQRSRDSWSFPPWSLTLRIHQSHIIMTHLRCFVKKQPKNVTIFLRNSQCFHLRTKILHKFSWMLAHPSPARKLKTKSCSLYRFQYLSFVQNTKTVATFR